MRTVWELFVSFQFDLVYSWLSSVRWTLIVVLIILALGWYEWYRFRFSFEPYGLLVLRGIFLQKELKLRYAAVTSVSLVAPWYYRPFGIVRLAFDTDAGNSARTDFSITISKKKAQNLLDVFRAQNISIQSPRHPLSAKRLVHRLFFGADLQFGDGCVLFYDVGVAGGAAFWGWTWGAGFWCISPRFCPISSWAFRPSCPSFSDGDRGVGLFLPAKF